MLQNCFSKLQNIYLNIQRSYYTLVMLAVLNAVSIYMYKKIAVLAVINLRYLI